MFKLLKTSFLIISLVVIFLFLGFILSRGPQYKPDNVTYGVTFSQKQALDLGLDWQETYLAIINELGVKNLRLIAYWDLSEPTNNNFDFKDLDWQVNQASGKNTNIILSMGQRVPRWPECHFPSWTTSLEQTKKQAETLEYIQTVIERYKNNNNIIAWQIENEPFLSKFGICPKLDKNFLDQEIALAKKLDTRPIVITDSGELSLWAPAASRADIFGTTMYRDVYSATFKKYIHYPITPGFFRFKKNLATLFAHPQKWIIIELQGEPWGPIEFQKLNKTERSKTMNLDKFKQIINFSAQAGFNEIYFWGAEYWYWEKIQNNNSDIWNEAKKLFSGTYEN